jgi:squalene synthase HpnD
METGGDDMALVASRLETPAQRTASGSSFYMAMRLLPRQKRDAMFAIYSFFRDIDDIADEGDWSAADRRVALDRWRTRLDDIYANRPASELVALAGAIQTFGLRKEDFVASIDGVAMDIDRAVLAPDLELLDLYCDRVASAVGRLSVRIFGLPERDGIALAHHLGRALQLTNILRDLDEDAVMGRLYLPRELLESAGIPLGEPSEVIAHPQIDAVCRELAKRAREHYAESDLIMVRQPRGTVVAPRLMRRVYGSILDKMEAVGWVSPRARVRLHKVHLVWLALQAELMG